MTQASDDTKDPALEIRQGALLEVAGEKSEYTCEDINGAFILLSIRTGTLLDNTNILQGDLTLCNRSLERLRGYYEYEDRPWLRKLWDSDIVKVSIFMAGMWAGVQIANEVR